jgi:hypothetical protein
MRDFRGESISEFFNSIAQIAAVRGRHGAATVGKCRGDALVERDRARRGGLGRVDDLQCEGGPALGQSDGDGRQRRRGPMLDGEPQVIAVAAQIEIGVAPGVELG